MDYSVSLPEEVRARPTQPVAVVLTRMAALGDNCASIVDAVVAVVVLAPVAWMGVAAAEQAHVVPGLQWLAAAVVASPIFWEDL